MRPPHGGDRVPFLERAVELIPEELARLLLGDALVQLQAVAHVLEVGLRLQLRHPRREHHGEQADQQTPVVPQDEVGWIVRDDYWGVLNKDTCLTELPELLELVFAAAVDDLNKHLRKEHRAALPQDRHPCKMLSLEVPHHVAEVDVEELAVGPQHDVVVVSVSNAKDKHGDRVAGAGEHEVVQRLL